MEKNWKDMTNLEWCIKVLKKHVKKIKPDKAKKQSEDAIYYLENTFLKEELSNESCPQERPIKRELQP